MRITAFFLGMMLAVSAFGAQSHAAKYTIIRNGHGVKLDRMDVQSRHGSNYAVVCFDAVADGSIHEFTPVFSAGGVRLVRREILDDRTWGYVFQCDDAAQPFMVFDVCIVGVVIQGVRSPSVTLRFRHPTVFWMPKDSARNRKGGGR